MAQVSKWSLHLHAAVISRKPQPLQSNILHCWEALCALKSHLFWCLCAVMFKCVARARGKYLLGTMLPAEQADVPTRPIHHMQKTADTASTLQFPNTLQQRARPLQNPNHSYPIMSPHDLKTLGLTVRVLMNCTCTVHGGIMVNCSRIDFLVRFFSSYSYSFKHFN